MATTINEESKIVLIDGTEITVRPLKISLLRDFMKKFEGIAAVAEDNAKSMNLLMECVQIAMKQYKPELAGDLAALEDNIDLPTVYRVVEAASGVRLADALGVS
jgi:inhibitor of KinA sporulation pathway (predicted exonuclease)